MICPAFCSFLYSSAAAMPYSTPLMFTSIIRFHSSILRRSGGACGISPVLLIVTSIRPYAFTAASMGHVRGYGECIVTVGAMRVRIELKGMFGIGSTSCAFDAVCRWLDDSDTKRYPANNQFGSKYRSASPS